MKKLLMLLSMCASFASFNVHAILIGGRADYADGSYFDFSGTLSDAEYNSAIEGWNLFTWTTFTVDAFFAPTSQSFDETMVSAFHEWEGPDTGSNWADSTADEWAADVSLPGYSFVSFDSNEVLARDSSTNNLYTSQATSTSFCIDAACTVPEPTTLALLSIGLAGLGISRRKLKA